MDVTTAYLHGELEEEIYVIPPSEFLEEAEKGKVWRLKKSIYGLKQSGRCWNKNLHDKLIGIGFLQSKADPCVYIIRNNTFFLVIAIYVDDFILFYNDQVLTTQIKEKLKESFEMKDLGAIKRCLGMEIIRDRVNRKISIYQKSYAEQIMKKFNMDNAKPINNPLEPGLEFTEHERGEEDKCKNIPYQEAIGSLLYLSQVSRPDITFADLLSRYNNNYRNVHWNAVKRLLRYIKGTVDYKLTFSRDGGDNLNVYCDADWGNKINERYSVTGYCFLIQGGAIIWNSKKQKTVALSSCEAEYMSISSTLQELLWIRNLISEINPSVVSGPTKLFCDNIGALELSKNSIINDRSKHIDVRHHFIREHIKNNDVCVEYIASDKNIADFLTKPLSGLKHKINVENIGLMF